MSFQETFSGKTIFITGHTGFKGAWLSLWLKQLGANVIGYSLPPTTNPNAFELLQLKQIITHIEGDVRDLAHLKHCMEEFCPSIVFHLAAQSLVLPSYEEPCDTFLTNAQGTVNILEAIRLCDSVKAAVLVTTDKCYKNLECGREFKEEDPLGGHDPYSASKAMAEIAITSYNQSFFSGESAPKIASARAGNVIGGGDFSKHRLIPDLIRALLEKKPVQIRAPESIRPWQHVLEPLNGYLILAKNLLKRDPVASSAWNFGPEKEETTVGQITDQMIELWGEGSWIHTSKGEQKKEMETLRLNSDKAKTLLDWHPRYRLKEALSETMNWYKAYQEGCDLFALTCQQIERYMSCKAVR